MSERGRKEPVARTRQGITPPMAPKKRAEAYPDIRQYTEAELRRKISRLARRELGISGREAIEIVRSQEIPMEKCHVWDAIDGWAFLLLDDPRRAGDEDAE